MKLKTLKDLNMYKTYEKLLKQEAIKWVRSFDKETKDLQEAAAFGFAQGVFRKFFNITEDDLK